MAGLLGIGSGVDLQSIIEDLMTIERRPLNLLASKYTSYETKLSAYSLVKSSLSTFQSAMSSLSSITKYQQFTASSSNTDIASITANSYAKDGNYSLRVLSLAQTQKIATKGLTDANDIIRDPDNLSGSDPDTRPAAKQTGPTGTLNIDFGEFVGSTFTIDGTKSMSIAITKENNTLQGICDAINKANGGVSASIVNDGSGQPYRLVLTNNETGESSLMKMTFQGDAITDITDPDYDKFQLRDDDNLASFLNFDPATYDKDAWEADPATQTGMEQIVEGTRASFVLDGITYYRDTNSITDVIDGVTISLNSADKDKTVSLKISRDSDAAKAAVKEFVAAYNDLMSSLKDLTAYDAEEDAASVLTGDSTVRNIQAQMRRMFNQTLTGIAEGYTTLASVGVSLNKDGVLEIDDAKLNKAMTNDLESFMLMFAEGGLSSNPNITFEDATGNTVPGTYDIEITQAATQGAFEFKLGQWGLDFTDSQVISSYLTMQVTVDGATKSITLDQRVYESEDDLAAEIQKKINAALGTSVTVEYTKDGTFKATSETYGSTSEVKIAFSGTNEIFEKATSGDNGDGKIDGKDVEGKINGVAATGQGQYLTGAPNTDAAGLKIKVTGDEDSMTGTISFSRGFAYQFSKLADELLGEGSSINAQIASAEKQMERIQKDYEKRSERIDKVEERYYRQFSSLDVLLSQLNATSDYLTQQLATLNSLWKWNQK